MLKKIVLIIMVIAVEAAIGLNMLSRRAPKMLQGALEKALDKPVSVQSIEYRFPSTFLVEGFEIAEKAPFEGETSFYVDHFRLDASPFSLRRKMTRLVIDRVEIDHAEVNVRKSDGRIIHPLSEALKKPAAPAQAQAAAGTTAPRPAPRTPLEIRVLRLTDSRFQFIDYDAQKEGFVITLEDIDADVKELAVPAADEPVRYKLAARMAQGRGEKPADVRIEGWTDALTADTEADFTLDGVHIPFFRPYYGQVTRALIQNGRLGARTRIVIEKKHLRLNADLEIMGLLFGDYEEGNQLFGLKAEEMLGFLQDRSGRLRLQFEAEWDLGNSSVRARDVIRHGIAKSLKATVLGSVGNILEGALVRLGDKAVNTPKDEVEGVLKKIKGFLSY